MTLEEKIATIIFACFYDIQMKQRDVIVKNILALIKKETVKAKSDELKRIERANIDNGINFWFEDMKPQNNGWRNMRQYVPDRIAQLKAELKQSNNKDT